MLQIDVKLWERMREAMTAGKLTANAVRRLHTEVLGKGISGSKAREMYDAFISAQQQDLQPIGDD